MSDLIGESRRRRIAWLRQEAMWRLQQMDWAGGWGCRHPSNSQIGQWLAGLDPSTVLFGARAHEARRFPSDDAAGVYQGGAL